MLLMRYDKASRDIGFLQREGLRIPRIDPERALARLLGNPDSKIALRGI